MKQKKDRSLLYALLGCGVLLLPLILLIFRVAASINAEDHVYTPMAPYLPEGTKVIEEREIVFRDRDARLSAQIPPEAAEEFVHVLREEGFEEREQADFLPEYSSVRSEVSHISNGLWRVDVPYEDLDVTFHVYDMDTGIYYYVLSD